MSRSCPQPYKWWRTLWSRWHEGPTLLSGYNQRTSRRLYVLLMSPSCQLFLYSLYLEICSTWFLGGGDQVISSYWLGQVGSFKFYWILKMVQRCYFCVIWLICFNEFVKNEGVLKLMMQKKVQYFIWHICNCWDSIGWNTVTEVQFLQGRLFCP